MTVYILINIAVVILITGFNLYRHQWKSLSFSAMLLAITINAIVNVIFINKYNFITLCTIILFIAWTVLQSYIDKHHLFVFSEQKFIAIIFTIIISLTQIVTSLSSTQSIYMSIPYLAPAIFILGAILLFIGTFHNDDSQQIQQLKKSQRLFYAGLLIIIVSFIIMMILTPYWYLFLIVYLLFLLFILWQKLFSLT